MFLSKQPNKAKLVIAYIEVQWDLIVLGTLRIWVYFFVLLLSLGFELYYTCFLYLNEQGKQYYVVANLLINTLPQNMFLLIFGIVEYTLEERMLD